MSNPEPRTDEARQQLAIIRTALMSLRKEVQELRAQCEPPAGIEKLTSALRSIQGNAEIVIASGDDPIAPILPWIVNRCKNALKD